MRGRDTPGWEWRRVSSVAAEKAYELDGPGASLAYASCSRARRQLVVYHAFSEPEVWSARVSLKGRMG
jgi:predicted dithiol-disulfide oxidoreductase (DUF899 family)